MNVAIDTRLKKSELKELEHLSTYKDLDLLWLEESVTFFLAVDNSGLISACFEFHEIDDHYQLAHMNVIECY